MKEQSGILVYESASSYNSEQVLLRDVEMDISKE